jgi:hypothetical protein
MRAKRILKTAGAALMVSIAALWSIQAVQAQVPTKAASAEMLDEVTQVSGVSPTNVDLHALKGQIEVFENLLNHGIQQAFGDQPFSILQDAKGSYLPGYGIAFTMEVNLHPLRLITPFDMRPYSAEELRKARDTKLARIRQLKNQLTQLLLEQGSSLNAMAPEQNIALVVHLFNLPSESADLPTQLSMSVDRRMLLDYQGRRLTAAEFQKAGTFIEF